MQRAAGQCVCVYVGVCYMFARLWILHDCACMNLHMYLCIVYVFNWGWEMHLCVCLSLDLWGFQHLREGSSACISMSQQLCLFAPEPCTNTTTSSGSFSKPPITPSAAVPPKTAWNHLNLHLINEGKRKSTRQASRHNLRRLFFFEWETAKRAQSFKKEAVDTVIFQSKKCWPGGLKIMFPTSVGLEETSS